MSMDFVLQEHGVPPDGTKDSNAGGYTREILDRNETATEASRHQNAQRTAERKRHRPLPRLRALVVR
jgi:hypothetical protein